MFSGIMLVQEIGSAEATMKIAEEYGATGGTILRGRGAAVQNEELRGLFDLEIEPEKDILLIITPKDITDQVMDGLTNDLDIEKANTGIMFSFDLSETKGITQSAKS